MGKLEKDPLTQVEATLAPGEDLTLRDKLILEAAQLEKRFCEAAGERLERMRLYGSPDQTSPSNNIAQGEGIANASTDFEFVALIYTKSTLIGHEIESERDS